MWYYENRMRHRELQRSSLLHYEKVTILNFQHTFSRHTPVKNSNTSGVQSEGWMDIHLTFGTSCERAAPLAEKSGKPAQWTPCTYTPTQGVTLTDCKRSLTNGRIKSKYTVTRQTDYRRGLEWYSDLLDTLTHNSWLHFTYNYHTKTSVHSHGLHCAVW
jgi:hypothetical protein